MKKVCASLLSVATLAGSAFAQFGASMPTSFDWVPGTCVEISSNNLNNGGTINLNGHDFYSSEKRVIYSGSITSAKISLAGVTTLCPIAGVALETTTDGKRIASLDTSAEASIVIPPNFKVDSLVFNRKFSAGVYSTISLPFSIEMSKIHGAEFYEFDGITYDSTSKEYIANWSAFDPSIELLKANIPYTIKPSAEQITFDMDSNIVWDDSGAKTYTQGDWSFVSTLDKKTWEEGDKDIGRVFGIAANAKDSVNSKGDSTHIKPGDFVKVAAGAWIRALRGYLMYTPSATQNPAPSVSAVPSKNPAPSLLDDFIDFLEQIISNFEKNNTNTVAWNSTSCVDISELKNGWYIQPDGGDFYDGKSIISEKIKKKDLNNKDSLCPVSGVSLATKESKGKSITIATLDADANLIVIPPNFKADSVVFKRTFTINTNSTISFPFSVPVGNVAGAEFFEFTGVAYDSTEKKWFANMHSVSSDSILANTPYIVVPTATDIKIKGGVKFASTFGCANEACKASVGKWNFVAPYERKDFAGDEIGKTYGFAANSKVTDGKNISAGQFVRVKEGAFIRPMRGYLVYEQTAPQARPAAFGKSFAPAVESVEDLPSSIEVRIINPASSDDSEEKTTAIGARKPHAGELKVEKWYDIRGRRLDKKPATKGSYYHL